MTTPGSVVASINDGDGDGDSNSANTAPGDALRISEDDFRATYDQAFTQWSRLHASALKHPGLPSIDLCSALRHVPRFPRQFALKRTAVGKQSRVCASGFSAWGTSGLRCLHPPPPFELPVQVEVASMHTSTLVTETPHDGLYTPWFGGRPNYVAILALAWSYILSARWAEIMPVPCTVAYSGSEPNMDYNHDDVVVVDIVDADEEEAQWWSAILQQGTGWKASMDVDGETFSSPWSVHRQGSHHFAVAGSPCATPTHSTRTAAASFSDSRSFLQTFVARHGIADQSLAALAAVLLFPVFGRSTTLSLPISLTATRPASLASAHIPPWPGSPDSVDALASPDFSRSSNSSGSPGSSSSPDTSFSFDHAWEVRDGDLDKLVVLSCYSRGIRPMLMSVFHDPTVACNASSASLQGQLAAISMHSHDGPLVLGQMLMERSPQVALLWLGVTVLGMQERMRKELGWAMLPINLTSAAWSETMQTFMQKPTVKTATETSFGRADECRLLYLCQEDRHTNLPLAQWRPIGATPAEDVDLEVRQHAKCSGHQLRYHGFRWAGSTETRHQLHLQDLARLLVWIWPLVRRRVVLLLADRTTHDRDHHASASHTYPLQNNISHNGMNLDNESTSENSTRMIFGWLRADGWARYERNIWSHEWFSDFDEDEDEDELDEEDTESCPGAVDRGSDVELWVASIL